MIEQTLSEREEELREALAETREREQYLLERLEEEFGFCPTEEE